MGHPGFLDGVATDATDVGIAPRPYVFDHERWVRLRRDQLSIDVIDPLGHEIGMSRGINHRWTWPKERQVVWSPVDGKKHVLVGEFDSFDEYNSGRERDSEVRIWPDPAFRFILDRVVARMSSDEHHELVARELGDGTCVECEITPHSALRPFFPDGDSPILGQKVGVYGPWVRDFGHGGRPEIHPFEVLWWIAEPAPAGALTSRVICVMQDDSNRMDWPSDYDGPVPRPWSALPRQASIAIALRATLGSRTSFDVSVPYEREMFDMPDPGPVSVTGQFGGTPVLTVTKQFARPGKVRMRLSPVVADPDGVHLRCFLYFGVQVSDADRAEAGFAVIKVDTL